MLNAETTSRMFSFVINPALIPYTYTHTHTHTHTQMKAGCYTGEGGCGAERRMCGYGMYKSIELCMSVGIDIDMREGFRSKSVYLVCI